MPSQTKRRFEQESPGNDKLVRVVNPVVHYVNRLNAEAEDIEKQLAKMEAEYVNVDLLLQTVARVTAREVRTAYATDVLNAFAAQTGPEKFAQSRYAIATPPIVVSADKSDAAGKMTGGQTWRCRISRSGAMRAFPRVTFAFETANSGSTRKMPPKWGSFRRAWRVLTDADPATQQNVFARALKAADSAPKAKVNIARIRYHNGFGQIDAGRRCRGRLYGDT